MKLLFAVFLLWSYCEVEADRPTTEERNAIIDGINSLLVTMETISSDVKRIKNALIDENCVEEEELTPLRCTPIEPSDGATVRYTETGATVLCEETGEIWRLLCKRGEWIGGIPTCSQDPMKIGNSPLRLVGNSTRGRLEVYYNDEWGTVCDDDFTDAFAAVICKSLGLPYGNAEQIHRFGGGSDKDILLDQVNCASASDARSCTHSGWGSHNCDSNENLGISCK